MKRLLVILFISSQMLIDLTGCKDDEEEQEQHQCMKGYVDVLTRDVPYNQDTTITATLIDFDISRNSPCLPDTAICICDTLVFDARNVSDSTKRIIWFPHGNAIEQDSLSVYFDSTLSADSSIFVYAYLINKNGIIDSAGTYVYFVDCL